jgi:tetratricopeptide (TPR) repeat protein
MTATHPPADPEGWDDLTRALRRVRAHAGAPSYAQIAQRVARVRAARGVPPGEQRPGRVTVYDVFRDGRSRLDVELVTDVVRALGGDDAAATAWRAAHAAVVTGVREPRGAPPAGGRSPVPAGDAAAVTPVVDLADEPEVLHGRERETALLQAAWAGTPGGAALVIGMPGIGKSALVRHAARAWRGGDDRQGGTAAVPAVRRRVVVVAADAVSDERAVDDVLEALHAAPESGGLVVVDDVPDAAVLTALVTGAGARGWAVGATSRRALPAAPATAVLLEPLDAQASLAVLAATIGPDPLAAEPTAAADVVRACAGLPLALTVAAGQISAQLVAAAPDRDGWSLADHARRLAQSPHPLPAIDAAYAGLPDDHARVLRRLALHPAPLPPVAVALLAGEDEAAVTGSLAALEDEHLVRTAGDGTVHLHDVVRRYAVERAETDEPHSARASAAARLGAWLADGARAAADVVAPHAAGPGTPGATPAPGSVDAARAWLDRYVDAAVGTAQLAAAHDRADVAQALSDALASWLDMAGSWRAAVHLHAAAASGGDPVAVARAQRDLGRALERLGRFDEALAQLVRSAESGHDTRPAQTYNRIGNVQKRLGRFDAAETSYVRAAAVARTTGDAISEGRAVGNRADVLRLTGRHDEARAEYARARLMSGRLGDRNNLAIIGLNNAVHLEELGDLAAARDAFTAVVTQADEDGDVAAAAPGRLGLARITLAEGDASGAATSLRALLDAPVDVATVVEVRVLLGRALAVLGDTSTARAELRDALGQARAARVPLAEVEAGNALGELELAAGEQTAARAWFSGALAVAERIGDAREVARARRGVTASATR